LRSRFGIAAALTAVATVASLGVAISPASAGPTILTAPRNSLAAGGSDTTYWMMSGITPQYNVNTSKNLGLDYVTQIPPVNTAPFPAGTYVPADAIAPAKTWESLSVATTPPDGSSTGITALDNDTNGQIDFARSSRGAKTGETSTHNFWAYALGALDFVTFPGTHAPTAGLTQTQLINIYTCNASGTNVGKPIISDWHQINSSAPVGSLIKKYLPQTGSGTYSFFTSKLMNGNVPDTNCDASHKSTFHQEHDSRAVTTANKPNAIDAFDWSRWTAQLNGYEADLRNGSTLGKLNGVVPSPTTVNTTASRFLGTRYVYNVVRLANHPSNQSGQLLDVTRLIGVRPTSATPSPGPGYICSGLAKKVITLAGFVPLTLGATGGTGLPNSVCRLNPTDL
jgi:ABC-type phosphate transport system substrate-binding protein